MTLNNGDRATALNGIKTHMEGLVKALDTQTSAVLHKSDVRIVDAYQDERGHTVLVGQYETGETREFTRNDYLPGGDDGSSLIYQAKVLEALSLEFSALLGAAEYMEDAQAVLGNPPGVTH